MRRFGLVVSKLVRELDGSIDSLGKTSVSQEVVEKKKL